MRKKIIFETVIIFILGATGWYLLGIMKQFEMNNPEIKAIDSYNRLVFLDGKGIDIMGNYVDSVLLNNTDGVEKFIIAFLVRENSVDKDLQFWNEVNGYLSNIDVVNISMIAYCENNQCIDYIRNNSNANNISVLEYGEVSDMQAVISADTNGEFWLRGNRFKRSKWRDENLSPLDIANFIRFGL